MKSDFDYESLNPGIRETVRWLHYNGFETCDSGDGVTNAEAGMECAMDTPMVACQVQLSVLIAETDRLWSLLCSLHGGVPPSVSVQASYAPGEPGIILLEGLDDKRLAKLPRIVRRPRNTK